MSWENKLPSNLRGGLFAGDAWRIACSNGLFRCVRWLAGRKERSRFIEILIKVQINSPGCAESFLYGRQVKRTRYTHQVPCAGLYLLLQNSPLRNNSSHPLESWISQRLEESVQVKHWYTVIELESILLLLVKSVRVSNFDMFVSALEQIAPWMFALDHTQYARWLPIFITTSSN